MIKGSSGHLSIDGSNIQKAERDAFRDFSRTSMSGLNIKLDPKEQAEMARTKTNIKIKDIDFNA